MSAYIISDIKIGDEKAAQEANKTVEFYNNMLIEKWNSVVKEDDCVYILGEVGTGYRSELRRVLKEMNGHKYIVQYKKNKDIKREEWKYLGIEYCWNTNLKWGEKVYAPVRANYPYDHGEYWLVCSDSGLDVVYKDKKMSIEAKYWDYTPLLCSEIPNIIDRLKVFDNLEENDNG